MNKTIISTSKKESTKKSPRNARSASAQPSTSDRAAGRAELEGLTTASLYTLLKQKNLPNRSRLKTKASRIDALDGVVTIEDLAAIGVNVKETADELAMHARAHELDDAREQVRPGNGKRLDVPAGGLDVHSDVLEVAVATKDGITWRGSFMNVTESIHDLVLALKARGVNHLAMESTAEYWLKPYWILQQAGIQVLVANAKQVAATQGVKTDRLDAARLALAFRDGRLKPSILCTPTQFNMRKLNRDSIKKTQDATSAITRVKAIMKAHDAPAWLMEVQNSDRVLRVLERILNKNAKPMLQEILTEEYADHRGKITDSEILKGMANEASGFLDRILKNDDQIRLSSHLDDYNHCTAASVDFQNAILTIVKNDESLLRRLKLILTLPSVAITSGLTFLVEVMDISFFWRSDSLVKWSGMAPRVNQSGYKKRVTGKIYKGGNKFVRLAAYNVSKADYAHGKHAGHPIGKFVTHLYEEKKKNYKTAVTAGGAKLLRYLFHVLALDLPFQEVYAAEECEKLKKNRERKLKKLETQLKSVDMATMLECVVDRLNESSSKLDTALKKQFELLSAMMKNTVNALLNH